MTKDASSAPTLVYVTARDRDEARGLARAAVEAHLAACANVIDGITSIYRWNGEIAEEPEAVVILKTTARQAPALTELLRGWHSYDVPCIVTLPITGGHTPFLEWISAETS